MKNSIYFYVLAANLSFALGSMVFTVFSRKHGPLFVNCLKAILATLCFFITVQLFFGWQIHSLSQGVLFLASGAIGLCIGDLFLLSSFKNIGPGRTLILFGFQPIILGTLAYLFLGQTIDYQKFYAIFFFLLCLITFSIESFKKNKSWQIKGLAFALIGVVLDAIGLMITRLAFEQNQDVSTFEGNFFRCLGALITFLFISFYRPLNLKKNFFSENSKSRGILVLGSVLGTFVSLGFYLQALKFAHLASMSAMAITGPIFASTFECLFDKKLPSKYLLISFIFFMGGLYFIFSQ